MRQPIRRHLLIESLQDRNLAPEFHETLLPSTGPVFDIATPGPSDTKRPAEHTCAATQKVGRTPENPMRSGNYVAPSLPDGYETQ